MGSELVNLGNISRDVGDFRTARNYYERAIELREKISPHSLMITIPLSNLAGVATDEGDHASARALGERALVLRERLAPDSLEVAESLGLLGTVAFREGDLESAVRYTTRAWSIVRAQAGTVLGDEARQAFESRYQSTGSQLIRFQVASGWADAALATLEEGRAQALLLMLAVRGVGRRLAPTDLWRAYEMAQVRANQAGRALERTGEQEARAQLALDTEIAQKSADDVVQAKRRLLEEQQQATRASRDHYTGSRVDAERAWADVTRSVQHAIPIPASTAENRRALPADTVLAAFVVGAEGSTLFLVQRDGPVLAFPVGLPLDKLTARIQVVRGLIAVDTGKRGLGVPSNDEVRITASRELYQLLFPAAARETIGRARRLLLSPDGVLWDLPFAALITSDEGKPVRYLGLEKPLVYTQSLTTFAQTTQAARPTRSAKLNVLAVGNALYDNALRNATQVASNVSGKRAEGELALLSRNGEIPEPLPYAEKEANGIAALYGVRASSGAEPTEAWFRKRAVDADIIHLATHGYFNPFRAMSSGIRLAVPEREPASGETDNDGALQAWEVFTQLQLRADLVVLSACESGVGSRVAGEGLVGLTRAFQAAGAASVLATKWRVADRSTASAMVAFHQRLRKGMSKDDALHQAMRDVASDRATQHPYYWAPFVLLGDFRPLR
jgi:CHAT domain-containing protein